AEYALNDSTQQQADIYILDINLPGMSGIELLKKLQPIKGKSLYLMCSSYDDEEFVFEALKSGAHGYILKNSSMLQITNAITDLVQGGSPMSPAIARMVINHFHNHTQSAVLEVLSQREQEVLSLLSKGFIYKEVASKLGISTETVRKHCYTIYEKLHVDNRVEAVNKFLGRVP
ncbi:MAG TPA: response regulator transcription factor, partial [Phnomibacter sp.]|nr:response regulator transcription factor [Phnomibacter sp.]